MKLFTLLSLFGFCVFAHAGTTIDLRNSDGTITPLRGVEGRASTVAPTFEDTVNSVAKVEAQFSYKLCTADCVVKATAGFVHTVTCATAAGVAVVTAGAITIRDAATEIAPIAATIGISTGVFAPFTLTLDTIMPTGIFFAYDASLTAASVSCTVSFR